MQPLEGIPELDFRPFCATPFAACQYFFRHGQCTDQTLIDPGYSGVELHEFCGHGAE
jgi:hypothetical protein